MALTIHTIATGRWRENCYLVHGADDQIVIIDPGADCEEIEACIAGVGLDVGIILLTHGHFDHIGAVAELRRRHEVPCLLHADDHKLVRRANLYRLLFESEEPIEVPAVDPLTVGHVAYRVAGMDVQAIHTPGHTPGSVCIRIGDDLFSGDTFHQGRQGRVDLPGGDAEELARSVERLRGLEPHVRVHPGHGAGTTVGAELDGGALAPVKVYS
jgi:glyoxylase-like metal-dependent hydrolase (beta-lactamase superfamily II)